MNKKILIIIVILVTVLIGGILYAISYSGKNNTNLKYNNEIKTMANIVANEVTNDNSIDEIQNTIIEETINIETPEIPQEIIDSEKAEVIEEKQETIEVNTKATKPSQEIQENVQESQYIEENTQTNISQSNDDYIQEVETEEQSPIVEVDTTPIVEIQEDSQIINDIEEEPPEPEVERCTNNNNHGIDVGNSGRWYDSKSEAIAYYDSQTKYWGNKWENFEIDDDTYYKNCPSGYEVWTCMYCGKWTINFYYR